MLIWKPAVMRNSISGTIVIVIIVFVIYVYIYMSFSMNLEEIRA